jgi:hypothetical protein
MSLRKKFKTDRKSENEGIWLDYGDGQQILVARASRSNKRFQAAGQKFFRKYRQQFKHGLIPDEIQEKIAYETYAKTIVLDWKGVRAEDIGEKGKKEVPFTFENCVRLFQNLPDLFDDLQAQAQNAQLFLEEVREEDAKN